MQASSSTRQLLGRPAGRRRLLAVLAALVVSLFVLSLEGGAPAQAVVGGTEVRNPGKYPFMVQLLDPHRGTTASKRFFCGGTMIDPNSVLTAAHCFRGLTNRRVQQIYVRVGATRLGRGVQRDVLRVWIHGGFNLHPNSNDMKYDVAVITLKKRVSNARFVALANPSQNYFENPGRMATVVGWGWTQRGSGPVSSVLREVHAIQLRSDQDGEAVWDQHFARALMIAAGTQKRGANNGDSGGPLLVADPSGKYWQIGISSFVNNNRIRQYACDYTNWVRCYDVFTEVNNRSITNFILSSSTR